jgi:hypothetical protein
VNEEIQHTLTSVVADLRREVVPVVRDLGDLQRNATLWLAVRAGMNATRSSFSLPDAWRVDTARLTDATYLAAIGFAAGVRDPDTNIKPSVEAALRVLMRRKPHTVERSGFADDPLCAAGLAVLATRLGLAEPLSIVAQAAEDLAVPSPSVTLALVFAGAKSPTALAVEMSAGCLAAAILCARISDEVAKRLFPALPATEAEAQLVHGLCRGNFTLGRGLDAMLTLAALELDPAMESAGSSLSPALGATPVKRTILFLASNPGSSGRLALDEEARAIETKLRASAHRDAIQFRTRWAVRPDDLLQALNEDRPTVVHFSGHGSGAGGIVLHDDVAGDRLVAGDALKRLFTAIKDDIRVVVLSACYSMEQARQIVAVIDVVVGMADSVGDGAARAFAAAFYRALGFGRTVQNAFDQGLSAIALEGFDDVKVPELLVRPGVDAAKLVIV